jgi:hypothetical protein
VSDLTKTRQLTSLLGARFVSTNQPKWLVLAVLVPSHDIWIFMGVFGEHISDLGSWQSELTDSVRRFDQWLSDADLADDASAAHLARVYERLGRRKLTVAFVAEFSRGKSELINALFFSGHGQRIVPSSAGRTTMCPTELEWNSTTPPGISLLPIETRLEDAPVAELRTQNDKWQVIAFDPDDAESLKKAFASVCETCEVTEERARQLGFGLGDDEIETANNGNLVVPKWRHALVNLPHPLLEAGLNIIDTPGLNAIGSEPELTLNTIPNAEAVLFLLAADAGVTRSDIDVWREHICPSQEGGRLVVLNKIDGLWDELKTEEQIDAEIIEQRDAVAKTLGLDNERVLPVSAQKGLVARALNDDALLARSRLLALEQKLSDELIPQRKALLTEHVGRDFSSVAQQTIDLLSNRESSSAEQLTELSGLRGKNRNVMIQMASKITAEREQFDEALRQLVALRTVFSRHSSALYSIAGVDRLRRHGSEAREIMYKSNMSIGLRSGMDYFFDCINEDLDEADSVIQEITTMMHAMYRSFSAEHGLNLGTPTMFDFSDFRKEIARVQSAHQRMFGTTQLVTTEKYALMSRFFSSVAVGVRQAYQDTGAQLETWLRSVMSPIENQISEHQVQLKRRTDSVKRVLDANESLEDKIKELTSETEKVGAELNRARQAVNPVRELLGLQPIQQSDRQQVQQDEKEPVEA